MTHYVVWKHREKICLPSKSAVLLILYLSTREGECTHTEACDSRRRWDYCTFCANKWLDFKWPFTLNLQESQRAAGRALNIYQLRKTAVAVLPLLRCLYEKRIYCARHITRSVLRWVLIPEHHSFAHSLASSSNHRDLRGAHRRKEYSHMNINHFWVQLNSRWCRETQSDPTVSAAY